MARLLAMGLLAGLLLAPPCQALRLPPWGPGKCEALSEGSVVLRTTEEGAQHWSLESPAVEGEL